MHYEFVQPIDAEPLGPGASGASLKRLAVPATQPAKITEWIQRTIVEKHA